MAAGAMEPVSQDASRLLKERTQELKSLRDIALETIREAIVSGYFKPGEHLKERELSQVMGISTTPIKEALRMLSHEGLVETIPRKGTYVSQIVTSSIEEILMLKASLEGLCARLAATKITDEELTALRAKILVMEDLTRQRDMERLLVENTKFHMMIREAAKNPMIYQTLLNVVSFDSAFRKRALKLQMEIEEGFAEHRQIFEAIQERNPDLAEQRMQAHIMRTASNVIQNMSS